MLLLIAYNNQGGGSNADGATGGSTNVTESSWGMAVTMPVGDALDIGVGYGKIGNPPSSDAKNYFIIIILI